MVAPHNIKADIQIPLDFEKLNGKDKDLFSLFTFGHDKLTFVIKVAVDIICPVVNMHGSGGRTGSQCWQVRFIMGPPLISPGLTDLSFWMCHLNSNFMLI